MTRGRRFAWVVPTLAGIWVALHAWALHDSGWISPPGAGWWAWGSPSLDVLVDLGALVPARVQLGEVHRLVTHAFLHASFLHLGFNLWVGLGAGGTLERLLGAARVWIVFFLSALAGGGLHVLLAQGTAVRVPAVGASGGIFGVVGALGVWAFASQDPAAKGMRLNVLFFLVIAGLLSLLPGVALWGHLGGLVAGAALMLLLGPRRATGAPSRAIVGVAILLAAVTGAAGFAQVTRPDPIDPGALRPFLRDLAHAERLAGDLHRRPDLATDARRQELGRRLAALGASDAVSDPDARAALKAYLAAWRPVADANVPDPFAFEKTLADARGRWREHEKVLRAASGITRGW